MVAQSTLRSCSCCGRDGVRLGGGAPGPGAASLTQRYHGPAASSGRYSGQSCVFALVIIPATLYRVGVTAVLSCCAREGRYSYRSYQQQPAASLVPQSLLSSH